MAVGWPTKVSYVDGDVYSAQDVNDSNGTINLLGLSVAYAAGKNRIINGDFGVWQRGTSFSSPSDDTYSSADRWKVSRDGSPTFTVSQQAAVAAAISGYNPQYYLRYNVTSLGGATSFGARQRIEDVRTLAGQAVTVSFWVKSDATRAITFYWQQNFGSGGSTTVTSSAISIGNATTSWTRLTATFTLDSISGKTIGAGSYLAAIILLPGATQTTDIWGVQLEQGSTATAFQTATGSIPGELAACERYYSKSYNQATTPGTDITGSYSGAVIFGGWGSANAAKVMQYPHKVTMRTTPTISFWDLGGNASKITTFDTGFSRTNNVAASGGTIISEDNHSVNPGTSTINGWSWCYAASAEL
jgi:hypothetical protein